MVSNVGSVTHEADLSITSQSGDRLSLTTNGNKRFSSNSVANYHNSTFSLGLTQRSLSTYFNGITNVTEGFDQASDIQIFRTTNYRPRGIDVSSLRVSHFAIGTNDKHLKGLRVSDNHGSFSIGAIGLKDIVANNNVDLILSTSIESARNGNAIIYRLNNSNIQVEDTESSLFVVSRGFNDALYRVNVTSGVQTLIGNIIGTNPSGITEHSGVTYIVGDSVASLFTIDISIRLHIKGLAMLLTSVWMKLFRVPLRLIMANSIWLEVSKELYSS